MLSIFSTLFSRLQQRCGLSLSVLQQLIRIGNALLCSRNVTSDLVAGLDHESCTVEECVNIYQALFFIRTSIPAANFHDFSNPTVVGVRTKTMHVAYVQFNILENQHRWCNFVHPDR